MLIAHVLGRTNNISVILRSYQPPNVRCLDEPLTPSPLVPDSYEFLSRFFPAQKDRYTFGRVPPAQGVDVKLPLRSTAPIRQPTNKAVEILIQGSGAQDTSSFYDIYLAQAAVWSMCK